MNMEEDAQQRITFLLQEIDANICASHRSATQICATVRRHHQILRQIHEGSQVWRPLFDSFTVQPEAARRSAVTPAPPSTARPRASPASREDEALGDTVRNLSFSDDEIDEGSVASEEQTFKTTTLKRLANESANESLNVSINSDRLPSMARTPYFKTPGGRPSTRAAEGLSIISETTSNWTPAMSSPPRTDILKVQQRSTQLPPTPPSAISSIAPTSPVVSKDLMKLGAFEYTPPHHKTPQAAEVEEVQHPNTMSPTTPAMPRFATVEAPDSVEMSPAREGIREEEAKSEAGSVSQSQRKRKRPGSPAKSPSPSRVSSTPVRRQSPANSMSTPGSYTSLRRKYSIAEYATPMRSRQSDVNPKTVESIKKASQELMSESPMTPTFELPSPLLRTQLKAMTPHTPLSNRLVGANLDIGSASQESKIQDYDESFNAGEPAPEFQLSLFPSAFQRGIGAVQISTLYSKFQGINNADNPALSVDQLAEALPDYGKERIEILLDTLVSRRLLRPFVVEGRMFWQIPV